MTYDDKICEVCGDTTMETPFLGMECCECGNWICEECTDVHYMMSVNESEPVCLDCADKHRDDYNKCYCPECGEVITTLLYTKSHFEQGVFGVNVVVVDTKHKSCVLRCPKCFKLLFNDEDSARNFLMNQYRENPVPHEDRL